jgi:hypothetical protein
MMEPVAFSIVFAAAALADVEPYEGGAGVEQRLEFLAVVRARSRHTLARLLHRAA